MTVGTKINHLGEVCEVLDSRRKPITKRDRVSGPYPYYGATGVLDYVENYIFDEPLVLIGEDGAKWGAGERTAYAVDGRYWVNNHAHVIRPNRDVMMDSWVVYYLNAIDLAPFISGLTVPKLNQRRLREIPIPLPPLPEQKRIVAILDEAFAGIATAVANTEKNLANARELFESYLNYLLEAQPRKQRQVSLFNLCAPKVITYGVIKLGKHFVDGVPCLRTSNVRRLNIQTDGIKRIAPELSRQYGRTILEGGEVLVNVRGTLGGVAVATPEMSGWNISREVAVVPVDQRKVLPAFAAYSIAKRDSQDWLTGVQKGVAYTGINLSDLRELCIYLPSIDRQKHIVSQLDEMAANCNAIESIYEQKHSALSKLKQSLLQKAFSGELTAGKEAPNAALKEEEVA